MQRASPFRTYARRPHRIPQWPPPRSQAAASSHSSRHQVPSSVPPRPSPISSTFSSPLSTTSNSAVGAMRNGSCTAAIICTSGSMGTRRRLLSTDAAVVNAATSAETETRSSGITDQGRPQMESHRQQLSSDFEERMLRMDECLAQVQRALVDVMESRRSNRLPSTLVGEDSGTSGDDDAFSMLEGAIRIAHEAHDLLEGAVPELSHRLQQLLQQPTSNDNSHSQTTGPDYRLALPRCCQLLDAWSKLCRAGHDLMNTSRHHERHHQQQHSLAIRLRGAPQRAQYVLDQMERTRGLCPPPPLAYHSVMECWSHSNEHRRATMAEAIFQRLYMPKSQPLHRTVARQLPHQQHGRRRPTIEAHRIMVHAWAQSTRDPRAAFHATGHLMKMVKLARQGQEREADDEGSPSGRDDALEPTMDDFRVVLEAWTRAEDKTSPSKADSALRLMENAHARGWTTARPDLGCYRAVLQTAARRPALPDLDALVDSVLTTMRQQLIPPDTACYEAAAEVYKNMAILNSGMIGAIKPSSRAAPTNRGGGTISASVSRSSHGVIYDARVRERCVNRAIELLDEIQAAQNQQGETHAYLSTRTVNHILEALSVSRHPQRSEIATQLLTKLEERLDVGSDAQDLEADRSPNLETYRLVMEVWKSVYAPTATDDEAKLAGAEAVLDQLQRRCSDIVRMQRKCYGASGRQIRNDLVAIFNAFVEVCGTANTASEESGTATFRRALTRLQGLRTLNVSVLSGDDQHPLSLFPNADSYARLLEACSKLLPNGKDRQRWVDRVFRLACDEGMVDDGVLQRLKLAVTDEQYSRLVISESEASDGSKLVPEAWTRNALRGRVVTSEGRRTTPLTVQGRLTVTPAMQEFRMRRLRDHRNRALLQGGRLKLGGSTGEN